MKKLFIWTEKIISLFGVVVMFSIVFSIGSQIVTRSILGSALTWPEEVSQFLLISMVFLGAYIVEKTDRQIKVDIIYIKFPKSRKIITLIGKFITLIYTVILLISEINLFPSVLSLKSFAAGIPLSVIHIVMFVGILLWNIAIIINLTHITSNRFGGGS